MGWVGVMGKAFCCPVGEAATQCSKAQRGWVNVLPGAGKSQLYWSNT